MNKRTHTKLVNELRDALKELVSRCEAAPRFMDGAGIPAVRAMRQKAVERANAVLETTGV